jgi:multiple sugar transport system substrate-binding protein
MKRAILVALVLLATLALCGCSANRTPSGSPVKITLFTWTLLGEVAINQQLCAEFEKSHPNIKVEVQNEPGERAMEKLMARVAAGNPPDVMSIHGASFMPMAGDGSLLELDPLIKDDESFDLQDFYPALVQTCRYQGKLYSLPRYASVYVMFYNKDLFDAAGLKYPEENWTWDDYLAAVKKLTVDSPDPTKRRYGAVIDFWGARILPWIWSAGGEMLDKSREVCLLDQPGAQEALQFLVDLRLKYGVCPPNTYADKKTNISVFTNGHAAMYETGAWDIQSMKDAKTLRWGVVPMPRQKQQATLLGTENYAIAKGTKHPKEAWELFKFLLGKECQSVMATKLEKQPSRQSVANDVFANLKTGYDARVFVEALSYAHPAPNVADWDKVSHFIQEQLDLMWMGKTSVEAGTEKAAKQVTEGLRKASH